MNEYIKDNLYLPVSLHDAYISEILVEENNISFVFNEGFMLVEHDLLGDEVWTDKATVTFSNVDFDFCRAILFKDSVMKEISFLELSSLINGAYLEIIDETYGYNKAKFTGEFRNETESFEFLIEIYHFGPLKFNW